MVSGLSLGRLDPELARERERETRQLCSLDLIVEISREKTMSPQVLSDGVVQNFC